MLCDRCSKNTEAHKRNLKSLNNFSLQGLFLRITVNASMRRIRLTFRRRRPCSKRAETTHAAAKFHDAR